MNASPADANDLMTEDHKHLVFRLADELYAAPLVKVREIIKMQDIKPVPFMVAYFRGILNLRGAIVSVVDLRMKLELPCPDPGKGLLVIADTPTGPIAAVVDDIVSVKDFPPAAVDATPPLRTKIPLQFLLGIGHLDDRLVNIIDIGSTLSSDDFAVVRRVKDGASAASA